MTLLVLLLTGGMIGLGFWQYDRLVARRAINAGIQARRAVPAAPLDPAVASRDPASLVDRQVTVTGRWDYQGEIVLRNRFYFDAPGFHVLTPLLLDGGNQAVLVDRGWLPYDRADPGRRKEFQQAARGTVVGLVHPTQPTRPGDPPAATRAASAVGPIDAWSRVDLAAIQQHLGYPLLPVWVEALPTAPLPTTVAPGGSNIPLPLPDPNLQLDDGPHLGYAIQWWAFAAILVVGYFLLTTQPPRPTNPARRASPPG